MDPPKDTGYMNANSMMVITPSGKVLQLFTPIRATCKTAISDIQIGTTVFIEAIMLHKEHKLCYKITGTWYVYWCFSIIK